MKIKSISFVSTISTQSTQTKILIKNVFSIYLFLCDLQETLSRKGGFQCEICKKTFTRKYSLKCHRNNIHSSQNTKPTLKSPVKIPPFQLGKAITKKKAKVKSIQKDRLRRYKTIMDNMERKIEKERDLIRKKIEQDREGILSSTFLPSPEYKQTKKITLEWNEIDGNKKMTVERLGMKPEFSWPKEWDYMIEGEDEMKKFRAATPDALKAYNHYLNQIKPNKQQQFNFGNPSQKALFYHHN